MITIHQTALRQNQARRRSTMSILRCSSSEPSRLGHGMNHRSTRSSAARNSAISPTVASRLIATDQSWASRNQM